MIPGTSLHYEFRKKFNRGSNEENINIAGPDIDSYLNEAQELWFKNRVVAADTNSEVRNDLRQFEVRGKSGEIKAKRVDAETYEVEYPSNFYKLRRAEVKAKKESCGNKKLKLHIFQEDDLNEALRDPSWEPSFEFEETIGEEYSKGLTIYAKEDFTITHGLLTYYRKPAKIAVPSVTPDKKYVNSAGETVERDQGFEVTSTYAYRNVVDIAVLMALRDYSLLSNYQAQLDKILRKDLID